MYITDYCFKEPASAKQTFSSSKEPSAFHTIPVLEFLKETWGNMANLPKFSEVKDVIGKGLKSLEKYHGKVNNTNAYFLCLCRSYDSDLRCSILTNHNVPSFGPQCQKCLHSR